MDRQPNADESDTTVAVAITKVTESVESILKEIAPSLIELSWTCDWLLRVARQGHQISDLAFERDGLLLSELPQTSLVAELHLPDTYGVGFGDITVDRPDSKKLARERLARAALDRLDAVANEVPRGEWTTRVARSLAEIAIDEVLDEEYPSGQRHYALDWRPQIRRDVALWVRRNLDDESSIDIATDAAVRAEDDPLFVVRTGGSRPRVPTTERGVREAIKRAQALLA
ncbi:MAG TPA: hypothetical protein QF624_02040 [Dehalococcoidia bacterium]|nr:hypothetical protein [Dehalococcoidia bacterium]